MIAGHDHVVLLFLGCLAAGLYAAVRPAVSWNLYTRISLNINLYRICRIIVFIADLEIEILLQFFYSDGYCIGICHFFIKKHRITCRIGMIVLTNVDIRFC